MYSIASFKIFISKNDVIFFELNDNGKYSYQDFIIPVLSLRNYERVSFLQDTILIKMKQDVFIANNSITKI